MGFTLVARWLDFANVYVANDTLDGTKALVIGVNTGPDQPLISSLQYHGQQGSNRFPYGFNVPPDVHV